MHCNVQICFIIRLKNGVHSDEKACVCTADISAISALHLETRCYVSTEDHCWLFQLHELNGRENEMHFVLYCPLYYNSRKSMLSRMWGQEDINETHTTRMIRFLLSVSLCDMFGFYVAIYFILDNFLLQKAIKLNLNYAAAGSVD